MLRVYCVGTYGVRHLHYTITIFQPNQVIIIHSLSAFRFHFLFCLFRISCLFILFCLLILYEFLGESSVCWTDEMENRIEFSSDGVCSYLLHRLSVSRCYTITSYHAIVMQSFLMVYIPGVVVYLQIWICLSAHSVCTITSHPLFRSYFFA